MYRRECVATIELHSGYLLPRLNDVKGGFFYSFVYKTALQTPTQPPKVPVRRHECVGNYGMRKHSFLFQYDFVLELCYYSALLPP